MPYQYAKKYFLAKPSHWPILGSAGLFFLVLGIINIIHSNGDGHGTAE